MLRKRVGYILYNIVLLAFAYLLDKHFQMLIFVLFFNVIMGCFKYRFHASTIIKDNIKAVKVCKLITVCVEITFLICCGNFGNSLYVNIFMIFIVALIDALVEFYFEKTIITKASLYDLSILTKLCIEANLSDNATKRMVMKYIERKSYEEIAQIECVDPETIRKSIMRSKKKIKQIERLE